MKKILVIVVAFALVAGCGSLLTSPEVEVSIKDSPGATVDVTTSDTEGDSSPVDNSPVPCGGDCGESAEKLCSPVGCSPLDADDPRCRQNGGQVDCKPCDTCVPQDNILAFGVEDSLIIGEW